MVNGEWWCFRSFERRLPVFSFETEQTKVIPIYTDSKHHAFQVMRLH